MLLVTNHNAREPEQGPTHRNPNSRVSLERTGVAQISMGSDNPRNFD